MVESPLAQSSYIYVVTRLRARKAKLLPGEVYMRMLKMSIPEITRFIGEHGYGTEIHEYANRHRGIDLIETALTQNLASSFHSVIHIAPGRLHTLTAWYLHRWDIINVMSILRALHKGLPRAWIRSIVVPAGELDRDVLNDVIAAKTAEAAIDRLEDWRLYPTLLRGYFSEPEKGRFARTENALYRRYYADLLCDCQTGLRGASLLEDYIRLELDITNFKNLLRLRSIGIRCDCSSDMIPGGNISVDEFQRLENLEDRDTFLRWFRSTRILPLLVEALRTLRGNPALGDDAALDYIWERWSHHRRPVHEVEMAVTHMRLDHMEKISKMHPFSVLPILIYLERKKYEVFNIRAIARGIDFGIPTEEIQRYLVI